jgi:hypothetical protein
VDSSVAPFALSTGASDWGTAATYISDKVLLFQISIRWRQGFKLVILFFGTPVRKNHGR